jgi:hypothetical protein
MALWRTLLAALIALAVTVAPVAAALSPTAASGKAAMTDCHGKAQPACPDCDSKIKKAKCPGDGSKCCKLVGTIHAAAGVIRHAGLLYNPIEPPRPPGWLQQPQPPPPRS